MLRKVHLHGALGEQFGKCHEFDVTNFQQVLSALKANFGSDIIEAIKQYDYDLRYKRKNGKPVGEEMLRFNYPEGAFHIIPVPQGSKRNGVGKIIAAVALIALAFYTGGATMGTGEAAAGAATEGAAAASQAGYFTQTVTVAGHTANQFLLTAGVMVGLQGISMALSPTPSFDNEAQEQNQGFLFNGPVNVSGEGQTIPLIYGQHRVGSVVASAGLETVDDYTNGQGIDGMPLDEFFDGFEFSFP